MDVERLIAAGKRNQQSLDEIMAIIETWEKDAAASAVIWEEQKVQGYGPESMRRELADRFLRWALAYAEDRVDAARPA